MLATTGFHPTNADHAVLHVNGEPKSGTTWLEVALRELATAACAAVENACRVVESAHVQQSIARPFTVRFNRTSLAVSHSTKHLFNGLDAHLARHSHGPGIELPEPAPRPPRASAVRATPQAIPPELSVVAIAEDTASSSSLQP